MQGVICKASIEAREAESKGGEQVNIEEARKAAKLLATRPAKSMEGMHSEDRVNGIEQMLLDLRQLAESDGCIAAAWAYELAIDVAAELARRETEAAERAMPITEEWLKSMGATIDAEDGVIELGWLAGELVILSEGLLSWTVDCVEIGELKTRGQLLDVRNGIARS